LHALSSFQRTDRLCARGAQPPATSTGCLADRVQGNLLRLLAPPCPVNPLFVALRIYFSQRHGRALGSAECRPGRLRNAAAGAGRLPKTKKFAGLFSLTGAAGGISLTGAAGGISLTGCTSGSFGPQQTLAALAAGVALRTFSEYYVPIELRQVIRTTWFCFDPLRTTNNSPAIACARVSRACGSATRRLFT
jgi:hypothetical protein